MYPQSPPLRLLGSIVLVLALGSSLSLAQAQDGASFPEDESEIDDVYVLPDIPVSRFQNELLPEHAIADDRGMMLGGIGSDLWHGSGDDADNFWAVTDRGPNVEVEVDDEDRRIFPVPEFTPLILHLSVDDEAIDVVDAIAIVNERGEPVTGLPNLAQDGEPFDVTADEVLAFNEDGLDVEGFVRTADGQFWLADEYRPSLIKVDATGEVLARYVPEEVELPRAGYPVEDTLPAIYGKRQENRGFEGLALSGDERTLYAVLQSPLGNPSADAGEDSRNGRILAVDTASGEPVAEYVYRFEAAHEFEELDQDELKLSALVWLDDARLLALERTDLVARLYVLDLAEATDILGTDWDTPADDDHPDRALETQGEDALRAAGVVPLKKSLLTYLEALPGMPDKIEGVAVIDEDHVAVINDNDFAIGDFDADGRHRGTGIPSRLLVIETPDLR
jgi:hypothetical protein